MHREPKYHFAATRGIRRTAAPLIAAALAVSFVSAAAHAAGPRSVADAFTATTANMTPAGAHLRIQIISWQEADARKEVVGALAAGADATALLAKLPTVGYVWPNGSPVGYALKYAHHTPATSGGEHITLVTDKRLGKYDYTGWSAPTSAVQGDAVYSVIELSIDSAGSGTGSLSLAAEVILDEAAGTVALADGAPTLLVDVKRETAVR